MMLVLAMTVKLHFMSHHAGFGHSECRHCVKLFVAVIRGLYCAAQIKDISEICSWSKFLRIQL